ncbi:MAG: hypothetical protein HYR64_04865 [Fimbriimonas ginsengisoli]|uniref:Uncharacterized protein n=1 Tax=Fimbriimonas ginsengisoli TaxID=1005039 RepID=A0A931LUJ8_FIMGI|nr:hypothetical protein [Fimbriimonas ginsengisoli]
MTAWPVIDAGFKNLGGGDGIGEGIFFATVLFYAAGSALLSSALLWLLWPLEDADWVTPKALLCSILAASACVFVQQKAIGTEGQLGTFGILLWPWIAFVVLVAWRYRLGRQ